MHILIKSERYVGTENRNATCNLVNVKLNKSNNLQHKLLFNYQPRFDFYCIANA